MGIARALVEGRPDRAAMVREAAVLGLAIEFEDEERDLEVWPEHLTVLEVFCAMGTQMSVAGMGGVIGYRYEALPAVMSLYDVPPADRRQVFDDFRVLEAEAVRLMRSRNG